jgi:hypothetical protein
MAHKIHTHPGLEKKLGLGSDHVIIDRIFFDRITELEQQLEDAKKWQSRYVDQKEANVGLVKLERKARQARADAEQQLEDWQDKAMSERHDLNMCEQEVERLEDLLYVFRMPKRVNEENRRLRSALEKYGVHLTSCPLRYDYMQEFECNCGLEQALKRTCKKAYGCEYGGRECQCAPSVWVDR